MASLRERGSMALVKRQRTRARDRLANRNLCPTTTVAQLRPLPPVFFPAIGSPDASRCFYNGSGGLARLEPPQGTFFFGFSPLWVPGNVSNAQETSIYLSEYY